MYRSFLLALFFLLMSLYHHVQTTQMQSLQALRGQVPEAVGQRHRPNKSVANREQLMGTFHLSPTSNSVYHSCCSACKQPVACYFPEAVQIT